MGARRAFDTVGDDDLFIGSTDEHRIADLLGRPLRLEDAAPPKETDDELLYRLGLGARAEEEDAEFERNLSEDYDE